MDEAAPILEGNIHNLNFRKLTKESIEEGKARYEAKLERKRLVKSGKHPELEDEEEEEEERKAGEAEYDTDLNAGNVVPVKLGPFPKSLLGKPIEEIDKSREDDRVKISLNSQLNLF